MPMNGTQARAAGICKPDARKVDKAAEELRKAISARGPVGFKPVGLPGTMTDAVLEKLRDR